MKIVYLHEAIIPSRTANSVHVMKQCQALAGLGHDVTLIVPYMPDKIEQGVDDLHSFYGVRDNFRIIRQKRIKFLTSWIIALRAAWVRPDYIYGRSTRLVLNVLMLGQRAALEVHEPFTNTIALAALRIFTHLPRFRGLVAISARLKDHFVKTLPYDEQNILIAHDGADAITALPAPRALSPDNGFHVGYIGHLYTGKGMETIAALAPLCPWAIFHIVGGYPGDIKKWRSATKNQSNIIYHGFQQQSALPAFLAAFNAVLAPYQNKVHGYKGTSNLADWMSPLKLFEYMAAAKPIICSDLPVLREILTDGHNALLCPPEKPEAWRNSLETLRDNPDLSNKLGQQAQQDFLRNYTWNVRAKNIIKFLERAETL